MDPLFRFGVAEEGGVRRKRQRAAAVQGYKVHDIDVQLAAMLIFVDGTGFRTRGC
jgi:hypothetical protein